MAAYPWRYYVFVSTLFCLFFNNVQVVSAVSFFTPKSDGSVQVEGRPFQLQCIFDASDHLEIDLSQRTVIWKRPDKPSTELGVKIDDNSKYGNITLDRNKTFLRSTLYVPEPPAYLTFQRADYECVLDPKVDSKKYVNTHNFPIKVLKAKAVPSVTTPTLKPAKHEETVMLNCSVTYTNTDPLTSQLMLNLTWKNDMKKFGFKNVNYLQGTHTVSFNHPLTVRSSTDGGVYTCQWTLKRLSDELRGQSSVFLSILPYLLGSQRKEEKVCW
ncbi:uncharacterized protein LOC124451187 [Xenia sp. Carnegie-2017]|uniref:uncharacterized protein LOC124451187 n=1 Tax=Xenia sp. Carnegie-2017 TaxID=2897299 RepID=UPI001F034DA0|nr:uncharacterized protein LOC124451187 [Xenia sp. Carnegie-2017]XP_046857779.1 uncharacterized protein LOC124451187 [Xenia sp. Carnegie-2017]